MTNMFLKKLRLFRDDESGASEVLPFALWIPVYLVLLLSTIEMGYITVRHTVLERALDQVVRDIRLGTGEPMQHDAIKTAICEKAGILTNCETNLRLEMVRVEMFGFAAYPRAADCTDRSEEASPVRNFQNGGQNELMVLRACYKFTPITPATKIGIVIKTDAAGDSAMTSATAFVQEPE